jgi:hypothetical protein
MTARTRLDLELVTRAGSEPLQFEVISAWNGGLAFRDPVQAEKHRAELRLKGIPAGGSGSTLFALTPDVVVTAEEITVIGQETSGEVEFALLLDRGRIYVAAASDHSDRLLETVSVQMSKQVCPNVISRQVWDYQEVKEHWDRLVLRSWVTVDGSRGLYQEGELAALNTVEQMLDSLEQAGARADGLAFLSGTLPTVGGELTFGQSWEIELDDPVLDRKLTHRYTVQALPRRADEPYQNRG